MKLLWSMIVTVIVLGLAVPVILNRMSPEKGPQPGPAGNWVNGLSGRSDNAAEEEEQVVRSGTMYRWRDPNGTLHIESEPPPSGVKSEAIEYTSVVERTPAETPEEQTTGGSSTKGEPSKDPLSVYTPEGFSELLDRVDETAKRIDERDQLLKDLEGEL